MKKHPLCVPPVDATELFKLNAKTGRWSKALVGTNEPALAYIGFVPDGKFSSYCAIVAECSCKIHAECPLSRALDEACKRWGVATTMIVKPAKALAPRKRSI